MLRVVEVLALATALDVAEADRVAQAALREIGPRLAAGTDPDETLKEIDQAVRRASKEIGDERNGRRSPLVALPAEAAAKVTGPALDLMAVFGEVEPQAAGFMLLEAANRLPVRYRVPLLLSLVKSLPPKEITELTGSPENTLSAAYRLYERELRFVLTESA